MNATKDGYCMNHKDKIYHELKNSGGIITSEYCKENNIPTVYLSRMVKSKELIRVSKGLYRLKNSDCDELYFFQYRYKKAIYSHETALYLLGVVDKFSLNIEISVPNSYKFNKYPNTVNKIYYIKNGLWDLGIKEIKTMFGNTVKAYSYERCLCDFIKAKTNMDREIYINIIRSYAKYKEKNLEALYDIAKKMGVLSNVREVMEVVYE